MKTVAKDLVALSDAISQRRDDETVTIGDLKSILREAIDARERSDHLEWSEGQDYR